MSINEGAKFQNRLCFITQSTCLREDTSSHVTRRQEGLQGFGVRCNANKAKRNENAEIDHNSGANKTYTKNQNAGRTTDAVVLRPAVSMCL